jgi:hypothetical protein
MEDLEKMIDCNKMKEHKFRPGNYLKTMSVVAITAYPWYAGVMSEINNQRFYDSCLDNVFVLAGFAICSTILAGVQMGIKYLQSDYKIEKRTTKL